MIRGWIWKEALAIIKRILSQQFIDIDSSGSLLSNSITRASNLSNLRGILIVAGQNHLKLIENTLKEFKDLNCLVLIEPEGRNTAPAIFAASKYIQKQDKESEILVMPSDHHYEQDVLARTVDNAMKVKQKDQLITFGIKPTSPEVGYGYIHHTNYDDVLKKIILFKEKPDLETARKYLSTNEFYWNSGINIFNSNFIIQEFSSLWKESNKVSLEFFQRDKFIEINKEEFQKLPNISIDYAILEKSSNTYTSEFLGKWSDVILAQHQRIKLRINRKR